MKKTAIENLDFILAHDIRVFSETVAKLHKETDENPLYFFEWGSNYYQPLYRGMVALRIEKGKNRLLCDGSDTPEVEVYRKCIEAELEGMRYRVMHNVDAGRSTSMFSNACADARREVDCIMIRDLEQMLKLLA